MQKKKKNEYHYYCLTIDHTTVKIFAMMPYVIAKTLPDLLKLSQYPVNLETVIIYMTSSFDVKKCDNNKKISNKKSWAKIGHKTDIVRFNFRSYFL